MIYCQTQPVFLVWSLFLLLFIGCQRGPNTAFVSGTVTVNGQPTQGISLIFTPKSGERSAVGVTDTKGRYTLLFTQNNKGCIPGLNTVRITAYEEAGEFFNQYIPREYNDKAPDNPDMNIEIKKGKQTIDFDVKINSPAKKKRH